MTQAYTITYTFADGAVIQAPAQPGRTVLQAAWAARIALDAPCAGNGTCGKCKVRLRSGETVGERGRLLSQAEREEGWMLACASRPASDLVVSVPAAAFKYKSGLRITDLRAGREKEAFDGFRRTLVSLGYQPDSGISLRELAVSPPAAETPTADRERLLEALAAAGLSPARLSLPALRGLPLVLREAAGRLWAVVRTELTGAVTVLALSTGRPVVCGLAVDIGTTSVSALLADLETGEPLAAGSAANAQIRYGADVINRIIESTRPDGLSGLRSALINECLTPLIGDICAACGVEPAQIYRVAAAGNTAMTHLLAGVWAGYIRLEPYVPAFFQLGELRGAETGLPVAADAEVATAPCIGSYVGGDITAGVFAALLGRPRGCSLFIDLGTNGEIVLGGSDFLLACACSAGPAFEGGEIGCGMRAANGAIEAVSLDPVSLTPALTVIGPAGTRPAGICGSGLIDLVAALFAAGAINAKGRFAREDGRIRRDAAGLGSYVLAWGPETEDGRDLEISEADLDNFIRAKGAVFAAVRCLLAVADCAVTDLQAVYIAGGIGGGINIAGAVSVGMLPDLPLAIFSYLGNTSLLGAYAMLISDRAERDVRELSGGMTYLELSAHPGYMDEFVAACFLPHTDGSFFGGL